MHQLVLALRALDLPFDNRSDIAAIGETAGGPAAASCAAGQAACRKLRAALGAIAAELNGRPRQTLGFKTPSQALAEALR